MSEDKMYDELFKAGLNDSNLLKIIPDGKIVIFKLVQQSHTSAMR